MNKRFNSLILSVLIIMSVTVPHKAPAEKQARKNETQHKEISTAEETEQQSEKDNPDSIEGFIKALHAKLLK